VHRGKSTNTVDSDIEGVSTGVTGEYDAVFSAEETVDASHNATADPPPHNPSWPRWVSSANPNGFSFDARKRMAVMGPGERQRTESRILKEREGNAIRQMCPQRRAKKLLYNRQYNATRRRFVMHYVVLHSVSLCVSLLFV